MVKQAIEQRRGDHGVAKNFTPFGEAAIGGEDHGAALLAGIDELEEQIAAALTREVVSSPRQRAVLPLGCVFRDTPARIRLRRIALKVPIP